MGAAKWPHLKELLSEVLRRSGEERAAFLDESCGGDIDLRRELDSLAAAHEDAGAFLEGPVALSAGSATRLMTTFDIWSTQPQEPPVSQRFADGTLINGRYRVDGMAGEGGMGAVYRVTDTALSRTLALKAIRGRPHFLNLFKIEFRTLAELRHPHLAQSYDFEPIARSDDCCFTMEFVEGRNVLDATDGMEGSAIVELVVQLCRVLAYVHNRGVVHRDIKPTNVLVRADGTLKLVDFGLVGSAGDADHVIGTPAYLAPELSEGGTGDHRSDLYSLGILFYQLLCRRLPFSGRAMPDLLYRQASGSVRFPEQVDVPLWLRTIILRLCAKLPSDRFRSANQVIEVINADGGLHYPVETAVTRESYVLSGRFVGRYGELTTLSSFVDRRLAAERAGSGAFALVSGQSGIGKSRLVRELRYSLQLNHLTLVEGNCFDHAATEYGAVAEAIAQLAPLVDARGGTALVQRDVVELVKIAPGVGRERHIQSSPPLVSADAERLRLLDTVASFLVDAARIFPYVLYINDCSGRKRARLTCFAICIDASSSTIDAVFTFPLP